MKYAPFLFALLLALPATSQTHVKWTSAGRQVELASGQMRYQASLNERNVQDGLGDWQPYVLQVTGTDSGLPEVFLDQVRIAFDGYTQTWYEDDGVGGWTEIAISTVHLERKQGPNWQRANISKPLVVFTAQPDDVDANTRIMEAAYSFGNAQQTTWVVLHMGGRSGTSWGVRLRANQAGEYRVNIEWAETETGTDITNPNKDGSTGPVIGRRWAGKGADGWGFEWLPNEAADHNVIDDGTNANAILLEGVYAQDEEREIFPSTWGPTTSQAVVSSDDNGFDGNGHGGQHFVDDDDSAGAYYAVCWRWTSIDITGATTIDTGTELSSPRANNNAGANGVIRLRAEQSNAPATMTSGNRPHSRTFRTAYTEHTWPNNGVTQVVDLESLIADLVETASYVYDGDAADAIMMCAGALQQWGISNVAWRDIATNGTGDLTIVYTVSVAGTFPLVDNNPIFGLVDGGLVN